MIETQRTQWILWGVCIASPLIYLGLAAHQVADKAPQDASFLALFLGVESLILAFASLGIWHFLAARPIRRGTLEPDSPRGRQRVFVIYVVLWAIAESIALEGLVVAFVSNQISLMVPFVVLSLILMTVHMPKERKPEPPDTIQSLARSSKPIG